jgi:hypothetical protein
MNALDPMTDSPTVSYRCSSCSRCFVAVDEGVTGQIVCICGAPLAPGPLPRGIYELRSPVDARATNPGQAPRVPDGGYGASHGYGPAHGGPTGPSDAPASSPL